ncbi:MULTISPECIES: leucine-rich repeat domain-containing protein [Streptomyces]|uniref:leucine-rich repeat domain-containing protein n=1 Tax=Streptomyces TaxID=1883 RepID=UPI002079AC3B|nr:MULTISPECIES: leucine-rich repeat domain-containing protein [Streptomyces]MCM9076972.1 leucine-rich repeat domain-containing protein [Streptomyces spororaveus]MCX5308375.1 leucine-rich repeat domain-containing protein [Streptomyces sp. NBC_00160]
MSEQSNPQVFPNRWADAAGPSGQGSPRDLCRCIEQGTRTQLPTGFHPERQDTTAPGWVRLLELVEEAAADGREVFKPLVELTAEQRRQVITLPPTITTLTSVKHLVLYGSNLVRIPPEIGAMKSLEEFTPYTSYRLHWFPYELTRCLDLRHSTVSTRAVYGNHKRRPPFPPLSAAAPTSLQGVDLEDLDPGVWGASAIRTCSVCDRRIQGANLRQVWISLWTSGADVLPLLVNACSTACVDALPTPAEGYVQMAHTGGPGVSQPSAGRRPR